MSEYQTGDGQEFIPINEQEEIEKEENKKYAVWKEEEDAKKGAILDGFPRTIPQAESLQNIGEQIQISSVVVFEVPEQILIERMLARGRTDDNEETIKQRFEVYEKEVSPVISFYAGNNLIKIDGVGEEEDIYSDLTIKLEPYLK